MDKKKVLYLSEAFGGGVFTVLRELSNNISNDYDIVIAYAKRSQTPPNFKDYFNDNIKFIEVKNFKRDIGKHDLLAYSEIRKIVEEENPDIIHLHSSKAGIIGRLAINDKKRKLFYTPHSYAFFKLDDSKIKRFSYKCIEKVAAMYKKECTTIACSPSEFEASKKITKNSVLISNGIDIDEIKNIVGDVPITDKDINKLKFCTIGRIDTQKNPKFFNQIALKFKNDEFTWIGEGKLDKQLTSNNIYITGWKPREYALNKLLENDIFLLPSLWEGLPISLLEAMYLGKICIAYNRLGNADVIQNGINGFLCNNVEEFVEVITDIKNGKYNLKEIANNARNSVADKYNIKIVSKKYSELYKKFT